MDRISVFLGDSSEHHSLVPEAYDFLFTDPPYGISRPNSFKTMANNFGGTFGMDFGEWDKSIDDVSSWIPSAIQNLKDGGNIVIFHDWKKLESVSAVLSSSECDVKRCLIWNKPNPTPFNRNRVFVNTNEFAVWAVKTPKKKTWTFNRNQPNFETGVFSYPSNSKNLHPTQKPVALAKEIINILTDEDDLIYDPFCGSGSFGIAAFETNRRYYGVEKEKDYYDLCQTRFEKAKGLSCFF